MRKLGTNYQSHPRKSASGIVPRFHEQLESGVQGSRQLPRHSMWMRDEGGPASSLIA